MSNIGSMTALTSTHPPGRTQLALKRRWLAGALTKLSALIPGMDGIRLFHDALRYNSGPPTWTTPLSEAHRSSLRLYRDHRSLACRASYRFVESFRQGLRLLQSVLIQGARPQHGGSEESRGRKDIGMHV